MDFMTFLKKALTIIAAIAIVIIDSTTYDAVYDATLRMRLH